LLKDKGRLAATQEELDLIEKLLPTLSKSLSASVAVRTQPVKKRVFLDEVASRH